MGRKVDVLSVMGRAQGLAQMMAGLSADPISRENAKEMVAAREAVAELIEAAKFSLSEENDPELGYGQIARLREAVIRVQGD